MVQTRTILISGIALMFANTMQAQIQQKLNIDKATVFLRGAELTSSTKLNLQKGENEIMFTNVAGDVNRQSLSVNATNGVVVEAVTFQNNYLGAEVLSPRAKEISDSIESVSDSREQVNSKVTVLKEQIAVLYNNKKIGGENSGTSVTEVTRMLDLINARLEGYLNQKGKQEKVLKQMDERLAKLKKQLDEEQKKEKQQGGQLLVKFYAREATTTSITIDYVVPNAGWSPTYDIIADDAMSPIKLFYKANIHQNSGVKWNNVRISLSTGNPNEGVQAPVMYPWYLAFYQPPAYMAKAYSIPNAPTNRRNEEKGDANATSPGIVALDEASMNNYVTVDNSGINTTFDIDLPYTIPCDGQQHLVAVKRYELPATYCYYAVPKLDKDAFLQAKIINWEDLNLLPGQTSIFYEGTYVGQGNIDARNLKDTMTISLGRDKKIVVKRDRDTKLRSVKTIGTNIRETFAYTITIRNARKEPINLIIQDQQPVSNDKDIVLEDKDFGNSQYDETTGAMKWTLSIPPNDTRKAGFGYTIKYPKGQTVANLQ